MIHGICNIIYFNHITVKRVFIWKKEKISKNKFSNFITTAVLKKGTKVVFKKNETQKNMKKIFKSAQQARYKIISGLSRKKNCFATIFLQRKKYKIANIKNTVCPILFFHLKRLRWEGRDIFC